MSSRTVIGYRVKLNEYIQNGTSDLRKFLDDYLNLFSIYEVKMNKNLLNSKYLLDILSFCINYRGNRVSFHLPKGMLEENYILSDEYKQVIEILKFIQFNQQIRMITHIPIDFTDPYFIDRIRELLENIPKNSVLLLENPNGVFNSLENFQKLDIIFSKIQNQKLNNMGFCLDFGHLLSEFHKKNIDNIEALAYFRKLNYLLSRTYELHLHDYNGQSDHLQLGTGLANIDCISDFISKFLCERPIIFETEVKEPSIDGVQQVNMLQYKLKK